MLRINCPRGKPDKDISLALMEERTEENAEQSLLIVGRPDSLEREYGIQPETGQTLTLKIFDGTSSDYRDFTVGAVLDQSKIGSSGDK